MKSPSLKLIIIFFTIPFLFLSCAKNENQIVESEIVFHVPLYKGDGIPEKTDISVFPNPFNDKVYVGSSHSDGSSIDVQLSNENGKFELITITSAGLFWFDTHNYPEGTYYIEVKKDGYVDRAIMFKTEEN